MAIDQSSAFNCIEHEILLRKLTLYNVGPEARNWVKNYLEHRSQFVQIGSGRSRITSVNRGVPQGSVVGPLLYAIYTNETSVVVKSQVCKNQVHTQNMQLFGRQCSECGIVTAYADDNTYTVSNKLRQNNQASLRRSLDELKLFFDDNQLAINVSKTSLTEVMLQQKKGKTLGEPPSLLVEKAPGNFKLVKDTETSRILGANVQQNMLWSAHLETGPKAMFPQVRRVLGRLKHLGK